MLHLFTREFGLVRVHVQSARLERSKHRYHLAVGRIVDVSLVRGRSLWRLTGVHASGYGSTLTRMGKWGEARLFARVARLVERLVVGEVEDRELFGELSRALDFLAVGELDHARLLNLEVLLVLRILSRLGYIGEGAPIESMLSIAYEEDDLNNMDPYREIAIETINASLAASHL